jgi:hypothetical protein
VELGTGKALHTKTEFHKWIDRWEIFDEICLSNPVIVSCKASAADVFIFGESHSLKRLSMRKRSWSGWLDCGGEYIYDVSISQLFREVRPNSPM